jgi:nitroreductase
MDAMEAIYGRRATRAFTAAPISREDIGKAIAAAVQAPSAMNAQPWAFAVVTGRAALKRCADSAKAHLLATMEPGTPLAKYRDMLADAAFDIFYGAPALVVVCAKPEGLHAAEDCCLAAQNLMLAAHASGIGTCWVGFARPWLELEETKKEIGIPAAYAPVAPIILGHPGERPEPPPRKAPEIHWHGGRA